MDTPIYSTQIFVGREYESDSMDRILNRTDILMVSGDGGIGKTSLLNHFIKKLIDKNKEQRSSVLVTKQPIDLYLTTNWSEAGLLQNLSRELGFTYFPNFWQDANNYSNEIDRVREIFESYFKKLPYDRTVLFFDAFEQAGEDMKSFLGEAMSNLVKQKVKTTVIIASRPEATESFSDYLTKSFPHIRVESLTLRGLSEPEIQEYFERQKKNFELPYLDISAKFIKQLANLTAGYPILIALTFDWLRSGNLTEDILNFSSNDKGKFKQLLVEQVNKLYYPVNHVILAMAHFSRRCNLEFLKNISLLQDEHAAIFPVLADFSFVKYRPATDVSPESWTLHDEMRKLVTQYVWANLDPQYELRQTWTKAAIRYYDKLIQQYGEDPRERHNLECERLFYLRFIDKQTATHYWDELWTRDKHNIEKRQALVNVLDEFEAVFKQLHEDELIQLDVTKSKIQFDRTHYAGAIKTQRRLIDETKDDDIRQAEIRSRLLFSYIYIGALEAGETLAHNSLAWLENKLEENLDGKRKNDFLCRISTFWNGLGQIHRIKGQITTAVDYYQKSLAVLPLIHEFDAERTATKINLAYVLHLIGDDDQAIPHCQTALRLSKQRNDLYRLGLAHNVMGIIETNALRATQAEYHFREATKNFEKAESKRGLAMVGIAHARMQRQIKWHKANPTRDANFSEIEVIKEAENAHFSKIEVLKKAEDEVRKAISFIEEGNHIILIDAWSEMGALCREQGNHIKAAARFKQSGEEVNQSIEYFNNSIEYFQNSIALAKAINNDYAVGEAYHSIFAQNSRGSNCYPKRKIGLGMTPTIKFGLSSE